MVTLTLMQWAWWTWHRPSVNAVFQVSMEALLFAGYAVIATGLGYRKTEHVETKMVEIEQADEVTIE